MSLINLYGEEELAEYICPVALDLVCDKVAEVRENAYHLVSKFISLVQTDSNNLTFPENSQTFCYLELCGNLV